MYASALRLPPFTRERARATHARVCVRVSWSETEFAMGEWGGGEERERERGPQVQ
jgi:hypothetical protein